MKAGTVASGDGVPNAASDWQTKDVFDSTVTAPTVPAGLTATEGDGEVTLSWTNPNDSTIIKYQVRQSDDGGTNWGGWTDISGSGSTTTTHTVSSLTNGTTYDFELRAMNAGGYSREGSASGTPNAPAAPVIADKPTNDTIQVAENTTGLLHTFSATDANLDPITWTLEDSDKDSFVISGSSLLPGSSSAELTLASGTTLNHEARSSYSFTVRASDGILSDSVAITLRVTDVDTDAPGQPDAPTVSSTSRTSVTLTWSAPATNTGPAITGYDVQYREGTSGSWNSHSHSDTSTTTTITGLSSSTSYQVQVRAMNDEGTGAWSDSRTADTTDNNAPEFTDGTNTTRSVDENTPSGRNIGNPVAATDADTGDTLTYSLGGTDAASFDIVTSSGQLRTNAALNYETDTSYSVTVSVRDDNGGTDSIAVTINVTDVQAPSAPASPSVSAASSSSLSVNWNTPAGATGITDYDVQYRQGTSGNWTNRPHNGTSTTTTITGLSANTSYQVQVLARNVEGESDWSGSGSTSAPPPPAEKPNAPARPTVSAASSSSLRVNWSAPSDASGITDYDVRYRRSGASSWSPRSHSGTSKSTTITGLSSGTTYQVQVRAQNAGGESNWSSSGTGRTRASAPSVSSGGGGGFFITPANRAPSITGPSPRTIDVPENSMFGIAQFSATDGDGDRIRWSLSGEDAKLFVIYSNGRLSVVSGNVLDHESGTRSYAFDVVASDGKASDTAKVTLRVTDVAEPPSAPDAPVLAVLPETGLNVTWTAPENTGPPISDYDARYRETGQTEWTDAGHDGTETSLDVAGLSADTNYEAQVRAANEEGAGEWSTTGTTATAADGYDVNFDGTFDLDETLTAIDDYFQDLVELDVVLEVIEAYFSS